MMYVLIGKEKCNQCNILKNLLVEKGIQYQDADVSKWSSLVGFVSGVLHHDADVSKIPPELLPYLRMYCNTHPIVLGVEYFSTFNETREHFQDI